MAISVISKEVIQFLEQLKKNNNREWFTANKKIFKAREAEAKEFFNALMSELNTHDDIEKLKMFRIYRDVRFSHDKTPYQPHFAGSFSRAGAHLRGGYYLRIRPGESFIATGFWGPEKNDLLRIRKEFEMDAGEFRKVINAKPLKSVWGELEGEEVKTAPKGFSKEDPNIDLIKKKQFIFVRNFTDDEVTDPNFLNEVNRSFKAIRPYFDLMSDILTTNLNGESLLD
ncbi:DUF2461 domain-containing protein [Poritiphilus flavus]|uniref:TIGR02453 family protein n=1 Tax=Poritiphilus flavus TaxID=2697053 RepID=A0A6L9EFV0_9FLAO|nr:DUF2461 domain-containing protein [Poritiphilus flavus]NAS13640.1 TIGR02453 family protein [Poritiphilus flavus]